MKNIDIIILVGGEGKRLRQIVNDRPKPMADVNGQPFLNILIDYAVSYGATKFILCTGYMSEYIKDYYSQRCTKPEMIISEENNPLGTAGAIKNAEKFIHSNPFLVMNGDSFCSVDLDEFLNFHIYKEALLSIVVVRTEMFQSYGSVTLNDANRIVKFEEKPTKGQLFSNSGIYCFDREVLSFIPGSTAYSFEYELFPKIVDRECYGFISHGNSVDIGTPDGYTKAKKFLTKTII